MKTLGIRAALLALLAAGTVAACGMDRAVGGPAPVSGQRCEGVPAAVCTQVTADAQRNAPPGAEAVAGIWIRCSTTCTEAAGEASVIVTYSNGQTVQMSQGWAGPPAGGVGWRPVPVVVPTPPVTPGCVGLPAAWCEQQVHDAMLNLNGADPASIRQILIRCTDTCTGAAGGGESVVTLDDGTKIESSWTYRSGN